MGKTRVNSETNVPCVPLHVYYRKMPRKTEYNFPEELIIEILRRVPAESLLRFMCVSKSWYSLITSPSFVSTHLSCQSDPSSKDHISTLYSVGSRFFMHQLHEPLDEWTEIDSPIGNMSVIVGCCHGVICLFDYFTEVSSPLILWNPSIKKALTLPLRVPSLGEEGYNIVNSAYPNFTLGFGFDLVSKEYKVVRVCYNWIKESNTTYLHTDVCSLSKSGWTRGLTLIEGDKFILECRGVSVNGAIHWICMRKNGNAVISKTVLTFDLSRDVFKEIHLPISVPARSIAVLMSVRMVEDKLGVSCSHSGGNVWVMMEYGNSRSWRSLMNVYLGGNVGIIKGAVVIGAGKTVVATAAGNWISWDCTTDKIENLALPVLEPDYMNTYVPSLVLLRYNNRSLRRIILQFGDDNNKKKQKKNNGMTARNYRGIFRYFWLRREGYLS